MLIRNINGSSKTIVDGFHVLRKCQNYRMFTTTDITKDFPLIYKKEKEIDNFFENHKELTNFIGFTN